MRPGELPPRAVGEVATRSRGGALCAMPCRPTRRVWRMHARAVIRLRSGTCLAAQSLRWRRGPRRREHLERIPIGERRQQL